MYKIYYLLCVVIYVLLKSEECSGVIYHLNDSEYDRMPPLSALDDYERCVRGGGSYCVARLDLVGDPTSDLTNLILEYSAFTKKHFNHSYIERGVCVTENCKKFINNDVDMESVVEACVNETIWNNYGLQSKMSQLYYCETQKQSMDIDWLDWSVAAVFVALVVFSVIGTGYDVIVAAKSQDESIRKGDSFWTTFSVVRHWRKLVSQPATDDPQIERLKGLHGAKAISVMITIIAHVLYLYAGGFTDNPHYYEKAFDNSFHYIILNGLPIVQIYFVIAGFLLVYNLQVASQNHKISWSLFPKIILMRWWRLTATHALILAFTATWLRHLSSGPLWNLYVAGSAAPECREKWWKHFLYIQNYESGDRISACLLPTWHITVDAQLFLVGLVVYLATAARARYLGVMLMLLVGLIAPALHVWMRDLDPIVIFEPEMYRSFRSKTLQQLHIRAENNLTCYAIGMLLAYKAYSWQKEGKDLTKYKVFPYISWFIIPAFCLIFYSGRIFYEPEPVPFALGILYAITLRLVIGVVVAYGIISVTFRTDNGFRCFFEWSGFVPLSRLSYLVYLLNMDLVVILAGQRTQLQHVSVFNMIVTNLGVTTLSFLAAVPLYLLVESPMNQLLKLFIMPKTKQLEDKKSS